MHQHGRILGVHLFLKVSFVAAGWSTGITDEKAMT
jgi:hypothetical protein